MSSTSITVDGTTYNFTLTDNGGPATAADVSALTQSLGDLSSVAAGSGLLGDVPQNSQITINFVHTGVVSDDYTGNCLNTPGTIRCSNYSRRPLCPTILTPGSQTP